MSFILLMSISSITPLKWHDEWVSFALLSFSNLKCKQSFEGMSDLVIYMYKKSIVIHDTGCPYWDQVLLNKAKTLTQIFPELTFTLSSCRQLVVRYYYINKWWWLAKNPQDVISILIAYKHTCLLHVQAKKNGKIHKDGTRIPMDSLCWNTCMFISVNNVST